MNRTKALMSALAAALAMAGCSGGGPTTSSSGCTTSTTSTTACTAAADLVVTLSKTSMTDSGTDSVIVTVTAVDASRNAVAGANVSIVPDSNAVITPSGTATGSTGTLTGTLTIGSDKSNRTIDVVVKSGGITKAVTVTVTGAKLDAATGSATPGGTATVQYHLTDVNSVDIPNQPISVSFNSATTAAVTDANGKYVFSYTVPSTATVAISATAGGVTTASSITTASGTTSPATGTITAPSIAANPSTVNVNTANSTANQVNVRALFLGAGNAPIQYARVRFDLADDTNQVGGTLTSGTGYVYTDANGVAQTTYIPGTRGSGNSALKIRACYSEADFTAGTCPNSVITTVTVKQGGVSLSILHSNLITPDSTKNTYSMGLTVQVVDSAGAPISGIVVTPSLDLPRFYRGFYSLSGGSWKMGGFNSNGVFVPGAVNVCDNEDINRNNVIETYSNGQAEDQNGTGKLEPYAADAAISTLNAGSDTTDAFGLAYFVLQYGQDKASWDDFTASFSATVQGTEGRASYTDNLPVLASVLTTTDSSPPFIVSPYNFIPTADAGTLYSATTLTVLDPSTGKSGVLCKAQP